MSKVYLVTYGVIDSGESHKTHAVTLDLDLAFRTAYKWRTGKWEEHCWYVDNVIACWTKDGKYMQIEEYELEEEKCKNK